jgi:hypothetical protein
MKKIYLKVAIVAVALVMAGFSAYAQEAGEMRWGVTMGGNFATQKSELGGLTFKSQSNAGLMLGVVGEYSFTDMFFAAPELLFSMKNSTLPNFGGLFDDDFGGSTTKMNLGYLQLPVNVGARYKVNDDLKVSAFTGPYFAYAVSGSYKEGSMKEKMKFGSNEEDDLKALDFGWTIGAGAEYNSIFFKIRYEIGLSNLSPLAGEGVSAKNNNFGFSIGYMFTLK